MHGFGLPAFAAPWPLVLASSSYADGNKNEGPAIQPRQILDDCVQAVQAGDFQRYVGHLSEQRDSRSLHPSVGILRKPRRFLVAALTETVRPTHISEGEQRQIKSPVDIGGIANAYSQTKWIVYTRGDYALALPSAPQADAQNVPQLPAQDAVNVDPTPQSPAMGSPSTSLRIVFRKIEKEWKIDRLLQTTALTPTVGALPPQRNFPPAQVYSSQPRRLPMPNSPAQPVPATPR